MTTKGHGAGPGQVPIAIIGMGCRFPGAANLTEFWRTLARGEDGITEVPPTHWSAADYFDPDPKRPDHTYCTRGGFLSPVPFDPTEFGIPPNILEATDTSQLLSLVVAKAALADAGYSEDRDFNRERVSVFLGITGTQELVIPLAARLGHPLWRRALIQAGIAPELAEQVIERIADSYVSWQENSFPGLLGNVVAGRIANRLNLRGTNCVIDAACASSLGAVHLAMMELTTGRSDMVLTGGADTLNDIFMHMCFSKTPALSPSGDARPFAADADGTVLGEGIGMLVLKRLEDAERDGDRVYAVIRAIGTSSDGRSQSIYAPHAAGQARCLRNAYAMAGIEPDTVTLIEAHGTGTTVGDATEFEALKTVFREARSDGAWCAVGSVKSQIGHTKAAAGAAGLIKAALAIHHRALPPTIKLKVPNPKLAIEESPFYLNTELRPWVTVDGSRSAAPTPRRAGVSSFGFGGSNFHAVLEEHSAAIPQPGWDGSVQIVALSAQSVGGLLDQLDTWQTALDEPHFDGEHLAWRAAESRRQFDAAHPHRLVLVVERGTGLRAQLESLRARLTSGEPAESWALANAYYGSGESTGKLGFIFPGQGSQYVGMARRLACTFPEFLQAIADSDAATDDTDTRICDAIYPAPVFSSEARAAQEALLRRTDAAQPAIGAVSLGMVRVLARFGVQPNAVCGHSYGELAALCVGGYFNGSTLHRLTRLRGRLMARDGYAGSEAEIRNPVNEAELRGPQGWDRGAMLAVKAPLGELEHLINEARLDVVLANRNSPLQGVLSGAKSAIAQAAELCKARGFVSKMLPVSGAFHSKLMEDAVGPFRNAVEAAAFEQGRLPVFANAAGQVYPVDPAGAKALLARQLVSPVDFVEQIEAMYDSGVRTFVEVGPRAVLTGLVGATLGERPHTARAVDASSGHRCGIADLARLLAELAAIGHGVELSKWERPATSPRKPKMVVPLVGANYRAGGETPKRQNIASLEVTKDRGAEGPRGQVWEDQGAKELKDGVGSEVPAPMTSEPEPTKIQNPISNIAASVVSDVADSGRTIQGARSGSDAGSVASRMPADPALADTLRVMQEGLRAMQSLQQQTAAAHQRFLETQEEAHRTMQRLLENQARLMTGEPIAPAAHNDAQSGQGNAERGMRNAECRIQNAESTVRKVSHDSSAGPIAANPMTADASYNPQEAISNLKSQVSGPKSEISNPSGISNPRTEISNTISEISNTISEISRLRSEITATVLSVVCEKTGYPREMVDPAMDIEADLGIDSIKRVEIIAAVEERLPGLPQIKPEHMGSIRTLAQIVDFLCSGGETSKLSVRDADPGAPGQSVGFDKMKDAASDPQSAIQNPKSKITETVLSVVCEKTGYPREMVDPAMDIEADLGIDSIKRVEIIAAVEERLPGLPQIKPEHMGSLRTLAQIVAFLSGGDAGETRADTKSQVHASSHEHMLQTSPKRERGSTLQHGLASSIQRGILKLTQLGPVRDAGIRIAPGHEIVVTDDGHNLGDSVVKALLSRNLPARLAPIREVASQAKARQIGGLIIIAPISADQSVTGSTAMDVFLAEALSAARAVSGLLCEAAKSGGAIFATVSRMDGAMGLRGDAFDAVQGGLAGLVKTASLEWTGVDCSAIDVASDWDDARAAAEAIIRELTGDVSLEVGLHAAGRVGLEVGPQAVEVGEPVIHAGDVVVVTGGARGVTAEAAVAMATHLCPTLVLLGRSPVPQEEPAWLATLTKEGDIKQAILKHEFIGKRPTPAALQSAYAARMAAREIARNLERIAAAGAKAVYRSVDVCDAAAVRSILSEVQLRYGPIRAIVHGAGVLEDRLIRDKTPEQFERVYATKVGGLRNLLTAVDSKDLRQVVLFSSVSARYGNVGQADYAMANEVLNKMAQRLSRELMDCRVSSINWGPWDGGMVTAALKREFTRQGVELIPLDAGSEALIAEMSATSPSVEVVLGAPLARPVGDARRSNVSSDVSAVMSVAFERELDVERHPFLRSHMLGGRPVLPVAMMMEWLAHAALHANPGLLMQGMENLRVLRPVALEAGALKVQLAVSPPRRDNGTFAVDVELRSVQESSRMLVHSHATVLLGSRVPPAPDAPEAHAIIDRAYPRSVEEAYEEQLFHGPHFQGIREICGISERGIVARVAAAGSPREWMQDALRGGWIADPILVDAGFQLAILWCCEQMGAPSLPSFVGRYRQYESELPKDGATCIVQVSESTRSKMTADIALVDSTGALVADITGYECTVDPLLSRAFRRAAPHHAST